jgi:hypothetical protein
MNGETERDGECSKLRRVLVRAKETHAGWGLLP